MLRRLLSFIFFLNCAGALQAEEASSLMAQALQKIQEGDKTKGLKLLERAFEISQDPEQVKEIAVMIIDASPLRYSKRENFLSYLVKSNRDHLDHWKWLKELGDINFERAAFDKAEDYYLQAFSKTPEPFLVQIKLAFTIWNLKRRNEAFLQFLNLYLLSTAPENLSLLEQVPPALGKIWWEMGVLPQGTWTKLMSMSEDVKAQIFREFFNSFPADIPPTAKEASILKQIKESPETQSRWIEFIQRDVFFKKNPCFYFESVFGPEDLGSPRMLTACVQSGKASEAIPLERHFEAALAQNPDEAFIKTYLQFLTKASRPAKAAEVALKWQNFEQASKEFLKATTDLLLALSESDWKGLYSSIQPERFEYLLKFQKNAHLLELLQSVDPQTWIAYEGRRYAEGKEPRPFLIKKARMISQDEPVDLEGLRSMTDKLLKNPQNVTEKTAKLLLKRLSERTSTRLPETLSEDFNREMALWVADLDRQIEASQQLSDQWFAIISPLFKSDLQKNIQSLLSQIDQLQLPPEASGISDEFWQKKDQMKSQIQTKYKDFLLTTDSGEIPQ